jgi:redox-sensitive bicupin YhaK (pirin superfamily)
MNGAWVIRRSAERGCLSNDWLDARFSFSFGPWRDARWDRFGPLLALNEDVVQPGTGFAMHPHADLEILIVPHTGLVEHRDSEGGHGIVHPGEVQMMRAGRGIRHSQMNPSPDTPDHHFQVWIEPRRRRTCGSAASRRRQPGSGRRSPGPKPRPRASGSTRT